eukprot:Hpha_TRINITY_DN14873_c0_g1::TRINITY_DN14873_c0_g1_i2::g.169734::m.169734
MSSLAAKLAMANWDRAEVTQVQQRSRHETDRRQYYAAPVETERERHKKEKKEKKEMKRKRERDVDDDMFLSKVSRSATERRSKLREEVDKSTRFSGQAEEFNTHIHVDRRGIDSNNLVSTGFGATFHNAQVVGARSRLIKEQMRQEMLNNPALLAQGEKVKAQARKEMTKEQRALWDAKREKRAQKDSAQMRAGDRYYEELQQQVHADNLRTARKVKQAAKSVAWDGLGSIPEYKPGVGVTRPGEGFDY